MKSIKHIDNLSSLHFKVDFANESSIFLCISTLLVVLGYFCWNYISTKYFSKRKPTNPKTKEKVSMEETLISQIDSIETFNLTMKKYLSNNFLDSMKVDIIADSKIRNNFSSEIQSQMNEDYTSKENINTEKDKEKIIDNNKVFEKITTLINDSSVFDQFISNYNYSDLTNLKIDEHHQKSSNSHIFSSESPRKFENLDILQILKLTEKMQITPNLETYEILIRMAFKYGRINQAHNLFQALSDSSLPICSNISISTYITYLKSFFEATVFHKTQEIFSLEMNYRNIKEKFILGPKRDDGILDKSLVNGFRKESNTLIAKTRTIITDILNSKKLELSKEFIDLIAKIIFFTTNLADFCLAEKSLIKLIQENEAYLEDDSEVTNGNDIKISILSIYKHLVDLKDKYNLSSEELDTYQNIIKIIEDLNEYYLLEEILKEAFNLEAEFKFYNKKDIFKHKYNFNILKKTSLIYFLSNRILYWILKLDLEGDVNLIRRRKINDKTFLIVEDSKLPLIANSNVNSSINNKETSVISSPYNFLPHSNNLLNIEGNNTINNNNTINTVPNNLAIFENNDFEYLYEENIYFILLESLEFLYLTNNLGKNSNEHSNDHLLSSSSKKTHKYENCIYSDFDEYLYSYVYYSNGVMSKLNGDFYRNNKLRQNLQYKNTSQLQKESELVNSNTNNNKENSGRKKESIDILDDNVSENLVLNQSNSENSLEEEGAVAEGSEGNNNNSLRNTERGEENISNNDNSSSLDMIVQEPIEGTSIQDTFNNCFQQEGQKEDIIKCSSKEEPLIEWLIRNPIENSKPQNYSENSKEVTNNDNEIYAKGNTLGFFLMTTNLAELNERISNYSQMNYCSSILFSKIIELESHLSQFNSASKAFNFFYNKFSNYLTNPNIISSGNKLFKEKINQVYCAILRNFIKFHNFQMLNKEQNKQLPLEESSNFLLVRNNSNTKLNYPVNSFLKSFDFFSKLIIIEADSKQENHFCLSTETKALYLNLLFLAGRTDEAKEIYEKIKHSKNLLNEVILIEFLKGSCQNNDCISSINILKEIKDRKVFLRSSSYGFLMRLYANLNSEEMVIEKYDEMLGANNKPNITCFTAILEIFLRKKKLINALGLLNDMKQNKVIIEDFTDVKVFENLIICLIMNKRNDKVVESINFLLNNHNICNKAYFDNFFDKVFDEILSNKNSLKFTEISQLTKELFKIMKSHNFEIKSDYFMRVGQVLYSSYLGNTSNCHSSSSIYNGHNGYCQNRPLINKQQRNSTNEAQNKFNLSKANDQNLTDKYRKYDQIRENKIKILGNLENNANNFFSNSPCNYQLPTKNKLPINNNNFSNVFFKSKPYCFQDSYQYYYNNNNLNNNNINNNVFNDPLLYFGKGQNFNNHHQQQPIKPNYFITINNQPHNSSNNNNNNNCYNHNNSYFLNTGINHIKKSSNSGFKINSLKNKPNISTQQSQLRVNNMNSTENTNIENQKYFFGNQNNNNSKYIFSVKENKDSNLLQKRKYL